MRFEHAYALCDVRKYPRYKMQDAIYELVV